MKYYRILLLLYVPVFISACTRPAESSEMVEADYVQYHIRYLEERAGDIPTNVLPSTMDAYYTRHFVLTRIEGFLNQFSLTQIANLKTKEVFTLLNFLGNKIYCITESGELPASIMPINEMQFLYKTDTMSIGGLKSHRVEVVTDHTKYSIYYSRQIDVKRPNITTPYHSINYVLTDFRIQLSHLKMHLTCINHERLETDAGLFLIPEDYRAVSKQTMEKIINSLFTKD
ncbi:MAG TPA: hypothetical protein ENN61_06780 [Bacteroidaceae bacterium]|nr:hypothetical protein [Bacteroidaceae bacterium]